MKGSLFRHSPESQNHVVCYRMASDLSFRGQCLTAIPQEVIEQHGKTCTTLDLTENQIHDFKWLEKFPVLTTLILDNNSISSLASMPRCPSIETLWINNNNLKDLKGLADCIVKNVRLLHISLCRVMLPAPLEHIIVC